MPKMCQSGERERRTSTVLTAPGGLYGGMFPQHARKHQGQWPGPSRALAAGPEVLTPRSRLVFLPTTYA
ncbi:Hypp368 [Branchiostoma lanceolatum]|uniref:Hypp368 protein n=1 Tax=Branchiostoma lanceolatum TaxID=7740 RepID=A0A8J9VA99_BRALA|nr:Hypp368 [Branchiostoma lanceolatum]